MLLKQGELKRKCTSSQPPRLNLTLSHEFLDLSVFGNGTVSANHGKAR